MGLVAAIGVAMLLVGFLLGTRGRQILATAKVAHRALALLRGVRIPAPFDAADADDGQADDNDALNEEAAGIPTLEDFLSTSGNTGLEDHPEMEFNPVLLYQVKVAKELERERKRQLALDALQDGAEGADSAGNELGGYKQNALSLLISVGARTLPVQSKDKAENSLVQERKRQQKTIDTHLFKERGIQARAAAVKGSKQPARGEKVKSALEVARETESIPHGGLSYQRSLRNTLTAKASRDTLREWLRLHPRPKDEEDDLSEEEERENIDRRSRADGHKAALDPAMLAQIAAEFDFGEDQDGDEDELNA